jgi:hypothetical protein
MLGIIQYLAAQGWEIWGIDGKRIELLGLRSWPNVRLIAGRIDHQARVAHEVFRTMQQRFEDYERARPPRGLHPRAVPHRRVQDLQERRHPLVSHRQAQGPRHTASRARGDQRLHVLARKVRMHALSACSALTPSS